MNRNFKIKLVACFLFLLVIPVGLMFASNVIVDDDLIVGGVTYANGDIVIGDPSDYIAIGVDEYGDAFLNAEIIYIGYTLGVARNYWLTCTDDLEVWGKLTTYGSVDPPVVLYDQQSREEVLDRIKKEVPPDKQGGAAMFFNKETKKLETYVASEGKFYDLEGNVIHELAEVVKPTTKYETVYHFDNTTGQARPILRPVQEKFQIKEGYALDDKTGNFINKNTKQVASREEALEIYAAHEGKVYDLQHNFVRNIEKKQSSDIVATGNNNNSSVKIKTADYVAEKK